MIETMSGPSTPAATGAHPAVRRELGRKVFRYAAGSVVATVCSEVTFLLLYGVVHSTTVVASVVGWLAGALPNYWLNRTWTWRRRGRPSITRELAPYVAIVLGTLVLAAVATSAVDNALSGDRTSSIVRTALVGGTFLGVYAVVFLIRFFLLDRLFGSAGDSGVLPGSVGPMSTEEPV
jgi:putative flippase GtrA